MQAAKQNIYQKLQCFQSVVGKVTKEGTNTHFRNKYADINAVLETIMRPLTECGLVVVQSPTYQDERYALKTQIINVEEPNELIESVTPLMVQKQDMQGYGSAVTYARRIALISMLDLGTEDDDGVANMQHQPQQNNYQQQQNNYQQQQNYNGGRR